MKGTTMSCLPDDHTLPKLLPERFDSNTAGALKNIYMFFSLLFRYPSEDVYQELQNGLSQFAPLLEEYIGQLPALVPIEELQAEYINLFVSNQGFCRLIKINSVSNRITNGEINNSTDCKVDDNFYQSIDFIFFRTVPTSRKAKPPCMVRRQVIGFRLRPPSIQQG